MLLCNADQALERCIEEAVAEASADQRIQQRYSFFRPVKIIQHGGDRCSVPAFSRDISPGGLGLFHRMPLEGPIALQVPLASSHSASGRVLDIDLEIKWCVSAGNGWYFSGGKFLGLSAGQVCSLLVEVIKGGTTRRILQRYPYYRPMTLTINGSGAGADSIEGNGEKVLHVLGRDISWRGVGLLHDTPLDPGRAILHLPSMSGHDLGIRTEIRWCSPIGEGWYVSGHEFIRLMLEEVPTRIFR